MQERSRLESAFETIAKLTADLEPVHLREHDIENTEVVLTIGGLV